MYFRLMRRDGSTGSISKVSQRIDRELSILSLGTPPSQIRLASPSNALAPPCTDISPSDLFFLKMVITVGV